MKTISRTEVAEAVDPHGDQYKLFYLHKKEEFASYLISAKGNTVMGHYTTNSTEAINEFQSRVCADDMRTDVTWKLEDLIMGSDC